MVDGALPRVPGVPKNGLTSQRLPGLWALVWCSEETLQSPLLLLLRRTSILFIAPKPHHMLQYTILGERFQSTKTMPLCLRA